jgi:hypothetical protein
MAKVIYDTSIFIAYKPAVLPAGFAMSAVVIQELAAGAADKTDLQYLDALRRAHEKAGTLLTPNSEDWWLAGKVLNSLLRRLKSEARGATPRVPKIDQWRIVRDVLIARTAKRVGAVVVTENVKDFQRIRKFCNVRLMRGRDYFGT